jgi:hypothetical protein
MALFLSMSLNIQWQPVYEAFSNFRIRGNVLGTTYLIPQIQPKYNPFIDCKLANIQKLGEPNEMD